MPRIMAFAGNQACVFVLTVLACANLIGAYGDLAGWAATVPTAAACGCLPAIRSFPRSRASRREPRGRWGTAFAFMLLCQFCIGPALVFPDTPDASTATAAEAVLHDWNRLLASFKYLISATPPVGADGVSLPAVWTMALWCAMLASQTALIRTTGLGALTAVPILMTFMASALLGTGDGWHAVMLGAAAIAVLLPWISARCGRREPRRWLASLLVLAMAVSVGWCSCALTPRQRFVLRDHYEPPLVMRDGTSPLSNLRSYVKEYRDDVVLTAYDLPAATPVRMAVMTCFDGNVWNIAGCTDESRPTTYRIMGSGTSGPGDAEGATARHGGETAVTFTIGKGLAGRNWLPIAGTPSSISPQGTGDRRDLFYSAETNAAIYPSGMPDGMTYTVTGLLRSMPSDAEIASSASAGVAPSSVRGVPQAVGTLASAVAGGQTTGGAMAQALSAWLHSEGWFSHGLQGEHPSLAGHGSHRISSMLSGTGLVGDSEQYASVMALMAQELGLPSRVVLGVVPKDGNGMLSSSRAKRTGGHLVTEFTGNDIEAWVEVELDRHGWVPFFPTPKETKTPDDARHHAPSSSESPMPQPPMPLTDPLREERDPGEQPKREEDHGTPSERDPSWHAFRRIVGTLALWLSPIWSLALIAGMAFLCNAFRLRRARRTPLPRACMAAGWRMLIEWARHIGMTEVSPTRTRRAQAASIGRRCPAIADAVRALADEADKAAFSGARIAAGEASAYWRSLDCVRSRMLSMLPRHRRWLALVTPTAMHPQTPARRFRRTRHAGHASQSAPARCRSLDRRA